MTERRVAKQYRPLLEAARAAGWRERPGHGGGVVVYPPGGGRPIPMHNNCTEGTVRNIKCQLRRAGLDV